jgi:hypothetical protein
VPSRRTRFSVAFTTNIAESNFRYTQAASVRSSSLFEPMIPMFLGVDFDALGEPNRPDLWSMSSWLPWVLATECSERNTHSRAWSRSYGMLTLLLASRRYRNG